MVGQITTRHVVLGISAHSDPAVCSESSDKFDPGLRPSCRALLPPVPAVPLLCAMRLEDGPRRFHALRAVSGKGSYPSHLRTKVMATYGWLTYTAKSLYNYTFFVGIVARRK